MFANTLDSKDIYTDQDNNEIVDLTKSIFGTQKGRGVIYSVYKVPKNMKMRPDLISNSMYGTSEYAEMVMKYSGVMNPFAIEAEDIAIIPSLQSIYNDVADEILTNAETLGDKTDLVKKYHKYIDPNKAPKTNSDVNKTTIPKNSADNTNDTLSGMGGNEPNISPNGNSGISIINGRIYFGDSTSISPDDVTDVDGTNIADSSLVDCARNGVTLGQFLNATITNRNNIR